MIVLIRCLGLASYYRQAGPVHEPTSKLIALIRGVGMLITAYSRLPPGTISHINNELIGFKIKHRG